MKIGTIINNHWAGDGNPHKYGIYLGASGRYVNMLVFSNNKLQKIQYYKNDFINSGKFEEVGYCNGLDLIKAELRVLNGDTSCK